MLVFLRLLNVGLYDEGFMAGWRNEEGIIILESAT